MKESYPIDLDGDVRQNIQHLEKRKTVQLKETTKKAKKHNLESSFLGDFF